MRNFIGPTMLTIGTVLVSSMFAILKSLDHIHPIVRASWRLQTTFLALVVPSAVSILFSATQSNGLHHRNNRQVISLPPVATIWSGCGYALYNVGLCTALAKTSLLRASILSQCAPLFIVTYKMFHERYIRSCDSEIGGRKLGTHWKHMLGVTLTLVGTGVFVSSTTEKHNDSGFGTRGNDESQELISALDFGSHIIGDLAAAVASIGYAIYLSCGQQAQRSVPVYIHLPGCVLVALVLVSLSCFMMGGMNDPESTIHSSNEKNNYSVRELNGEIDDSCSNILGWVCPQYLSRVAYLGIVCGAIAVGMINWSLNHVSALQAAAANSAEPITASIIGVVVFSEPVPNFVAVFAAAIIILAMLLCSADDERSNGSEKKEALVQNSEITPNRKMRKYMISPVQLMSFKGLMMISLLIMEGSLIYYYQQHLPKVGKMEILKGLSSNQYTFA
mmetsp:Transcript_21925/g.52181  ORF Transcript_21925/g.52181 Transcript_21925/m.52181 type:complete len:447 (-) Transcript_21925:60-1400(-)